MKRNRESTYIDNPFIKEENKNWAIGEPASLTRSISPPPTDSRRRLKQPKSSTAQVEAGEKHVEDHVVFFSEKLLSASRPYLPEIPRLDHKSWINLYAANESISNGHHFVIHQHDHPVAGTHYDLRLQCNAMSSVSWAIMYGLPGDPNSRRLNRNATETRIHCLWNHLIETASHQTGTLLIWDTGIYEVLPYPDSSAQPNRANTYEEETDTDNERGTAASISEWHRFSEPEKLHRSFQNRRIRLRLHGTRLPQGYTLLLWLRQENNRTEQPAAPRTRRKKGSVRTSNSSLSRNPKSKSSYNTDSDRDSSDTAKLPVISPTQLRRNVSSLHRYESPPSNPNPNPQVENLQASLTSTNTSTTTTSNKTSPPSNSHEENQEEQIRLTNAYTGATNTINSIHQRRWYLCLDRQTSGFTKDSSTGKWVSRPSVPQIHHQQIHTHTHSSTETPNPTQTGDSSSEADMGEVITDSETVRPAKIMPKRAKPEYHGFQPFHVLGREQERSVITGRLASEILADEGVIGYVPRGKWRAVTE